MRILWLHQYFATPAGWGSVRTYEFGRRFVAAGHKVDVLCCAAYDSSLAGQRVVESDGMRVLVSRTRYRPQMGFAARVGSFLSFAGFALWQVWRHGRQYDLIIASSSPLTMALPALLARRLYVTPFVFEVIDVWPDAAIAAGVLRNRMLQWLAFRLEARAYQRASRIVTCSSGMTERVQCKLNRTPMPGMAVGGSGGPALPVRNAVGGSGGPALPVHNAVGGSGGPALPVRNAVGGSGGPALPVHNEGLVGRGRRTRRLNADALQAELQKIVTIPNSCDLGVFRPDAARRAATRAALGVRDDQLVVLYTGAMGRSNAVDDIVQTARLLAEDARIVWWFAGDGAEAGKLRQVAAGASGDSGGPGAPRTGGSGPVRGIDACPPAERPGHLCGLPASRFFGSLPREKIVELCQAADVALVTFMHAPFFHENSPNKFFDAIAAGLPVIFNRSTWLEADIAAYGCGFVCAGEQPAAAMASRLRELAADPELCRRMGAGARRLAEERYSRDGLAQKYLEALQ